MGGYAENRNKQEECEKSWQEDGISLVTIVSQPNECLKFGPKGPVKLIQRVQIAHSFLHVMSKLFQFTILNLSGCFSIHLSKNFSKRFTNKSKITMFYS